MAVSEASVLWPKDPSIADSDDWPVYSLREVNVLSRLTGETVSLFTANGDDPIRVIGYLEKIDKPRSKFVLDTSYETKLIEVTEICSYTFAESENGMSDFWVEGYAGWFLLKEPAPSYKETFSKMQECISMFSFMAKRDRMLRRKFKREGSNLDGDRGKSSYASSIFTSDLFSEIRARVCDDEYARKPEVQGAKKGEERKVESGKAEGRNVEGKNEERNAESKKAEERNVESKKPEGTKVESKKPKGKKVEIGGKVEETQLALNPKSRMEDPNSRQSRKAKSIIPTRGGLAMYPRYLGEDIREEVNDRVRRREALAGSEKNKFAVSFSSEDELTGARGSPKNPSKRKLNFSKPRTPYKPTKANLSEDELEQPKATKVGRSATDDIIMLDSDTPEGDDVALRTKSPSMRPTRCTPRGRGASRPRIRNSTTRNNPSTPEWTVGVDHGGFGADEDDNSTMPVTRPSRYETWAAQPMDSKPAPRNNPSTPEWTAGVDHGGFGADEDDNSTMPDTRPSRYETWAAQPMDSKPAPYHTYPPRRFLEVSVQRFELPDDRPQTRQSHGLVVDIQAFEGAALAFVMPSVSTEQPSDKNFVSISGFAKVYLLDGTIVRNVLPSKSLDAHLSPKGLNLSAQSSRIAQRLSQGRTDYVEIKHYPNGDLVAFLVDYRPTHVYGVIHSDVALRQFFAYDELNPRLRDFNSFEKAPRCLPMDYEVLNMVVSDLFALGSTLYELIAKKTSYSELYPVESRVESRASRVSCRYE
ncbi:hypothetical protein MMC31_006472 [Peltigera leucophlebia]|nr:hypothetical protein [Peltigera leucophlebia]